MLAIKSFTISPSFDGLILQWQIDATAKYNFEIVRSESPVFGSSAISVLTGTELTDPSQRKDEETRVAQDNRIWYYRVTVTEDNATVDKVVSIQPTNLTISRVILEKQATALKPVFGGRAVTLFIRKTIGPLCPNCWDDRRQRKTKSNCDVCYETGIVGGYYSGITVQASKFPVPMIEKLDKFGIANKNMPMMWTSNYPELKSGENTGDVLFDTVDKRHYKLTQVEKSELQGCLTQRMSLMELSPESIECALGV